MSVVYAVQRKIRSDGSDEFDMRPALRWGELRYLLGPTAKPWDPSVLGELRYKLVSFRSFEDHLLLVGNPVLIGLTCVVAAQRGTRLSMLQWDGARREYRQAVFGNNDWSSAWR